ncbi:MAG: hypothetical protein HDS18_03040 [Bacteroides sp.]|nr:hypothetical protein [Bacteroides sp.]
MVKTDIIKSPNPGFSPDLEGGGSGASGSRPQHSVEAGASGAAAEAGAVSNNGVTATPNAAAPGVVASGGAVGAQTNAEADPYAVTQQMRDEATKGYDVALKHYYDWLDKHPEETEEQRKKREKKERSRKIMSAVGDGLSAIANVYFTSQYAPDMYDPQNSSLKAVNDRIEKLKLDREKEAEQRRAYIERTAKGEAERARTVRELEAQMEARKIAAQKAQQEAERHQWEREDRPVRQQIAQNELAISGHKVTQEGEKARVAGQLADEEVRSAQQGTAYKKAQTVAAYASANADNKRAQSYDKDAPHYRGKVYPSKEDYWKDVSEDARLYNERHAKDKDFVPIRYYDEVMDQNGNRRQVARDPKEYAGELETRLAAEKPAFNAQDYKRGKSGKSGGTKGGGSSKPPLN